MYYLIGYAICLTFTVGLLAWVLVLRMHFSVNVKKALSGIVAAATLLLSILFVSFIPFKWVNILFYIGLVIGYFLIVSLIYWIVHFIYGKIVAKRQLDDEEAEMQSEQPVKKKAPKETVLSFDRSKKKQTTRKDEKRPVKQTVQKGEPKKDKQPVSQPKQSPAVSKTKVPAKVNPKASAVTKNTAAKQAPAKKAPVKKAEMSQQPPVFGKGYVRPVEEKTTKKPIPGPSAAEEARMARSQQRAQKPAPIKKRNSPFKK